VIVASRAGGSRRTARALEGRVTGALKGDMPLWIARFPDATVASQLGAACWWRR
jgi:hypothetical protein